MGLRARMYGAIATLFVMLFTVIGGVGFYFYYTGAVDATLLVIICLFLTIFLLLLDWGISPIIIKHVFEIQWVEGHSSKINRYIDTICEEYNMKRPKLGIIDDNNPNAFCFGWTKNRSFLVITKGIKKYCDRDEQRAVIAHEMGHIAHHDFVIMTIISAIPMVFYMFYAGAREVIHTRGGEGELEEKGQAVSMAVVIAAVSYIIYVLSEFIVLLVSRYREYYADRFAAETTRRPAKMASALVKIAYGLATEVNEGESHRDHDPYESALMIFNARAARALALNASDKTKKVDKDTMEKAMAWDLWNPWAFFLELRSTHPLPAKRINALDDYAKEQGMKTLIDFDLEKTETYWDDFLVDVLMSKLWMFAIPLALLAFLYVNIIVALGVFLFFLGILLLISYTTFKYPHRFKEAKVKDLLVDVKASPVRGRPVRLQGKIIGRGVPGLYFSEDLKMDDKTGLILLDYHQVSRMVNFFVGVFGTKWKIGRRAVVEGWYRRRIVPYVEIHGMKIGKKWKRIHTQMLLHILAGLVSFFGFLLMMYGLRIGMI
jgi:Zn-dependent protease with chaperone function